LLGAAFFADAFLGAASALRPITHATKVAAKRKRRMVDESFRTVARPVKADDRFIFCM
jgi:hypothetical protein